MKHSLLNLALITALGSFAGAAEAQQPVQIGADLEQKVIEWRRDLHQHPELSNREFRTAKVITEHLKTLGLEVQTGVAHTGVVGLLKGAKPGPTIALRADMDALPVTELTDVPFASKAISEYRGKEVGVMHACGHDLHVAMLMGAAEKLTAMRDQLAGNVVFIFQPAEEGAPAGEEGGAELMLKEGLFKQYQPEAVFGIHVWSAGNTGEIGYREGPLMASSDRFEINVKGRQTHGSRPWGGVDPIVAAGQIISNTQSIVSRQVDITKAPAVVSFGIVEGGVRNNIIPDEVYLEGTIRNFDMDNRAQIFENLKATAEHTAKASGAEAHVHIDEGYPVTINDPELTRKMLPTMQRVAGTDNVKVNALVTGAEDFSFYALEVPGLFVFLGITPEGQDPAEAPSNHSPYFYADEDALKTGTELYVNWVFDYAKLK
ncbi:M20 family metallopeptidase [Pseudidiomarina andamanensis]|uniref:Amidohydrolase n=1 Tax=Pseudidiomarina andamanensis TaxID=1940690 RepID=A0AA92EUL8_9GAMM|nr:M20 family metallopeptidase [Pseudidiomarina andamanensis]MDS0219267.1 M20 family metallopeptidase [Pseudidiomarina andamanensis]QGT96006.1 amidohydrolase [Pseudidiomarina andamanensis]